MPCGVFWHKACSPRTMLRELRAVAVGAAKGFYEDEILSSSAALAYYSLLSMAPLLLVVVSVAGVFFSDGAVQTQLVAQIRSLVGPEGAELADTVIRNNEGLGQSWVSLAIGTVLTIFGASTVFAHLQQTLNRVWDVEPKPTNAVWEFLKHRLLSFALVVTLGFLLMISLVASAVLTALYEHIEALTGSAALWRTLNVAVSFGLAGAPADCDDVPPSAGRPNRLARHVGRRGHHGRPVRRRQVGNRPVPRPGDVRVGFRCRRLRRRLHGLDVLRVADR